MVRWLRVGGICTVAGKMGYCSWDSCHCKCSHSCGNTGGAVIQECIEEALISWHLGSLDFLLSPHSRVGKGSFDEDHDWHLTLVTAHGFCFSIGVRCPLPSLLTSIANLQICPWFGSYRTSGDV